MNVQKQRSSWDGIFCEWRRILRRPGADRREMRIASVLFVLFGAVLIRYLVSLYPYSGFQKPPMFGDFEAQRHWMEITTKIPVTDWYRNTTDNDLEYWGIDYPPLSSYHSWVAGKLFEKFEPPAVELHLSRGYETPSSKLFMRFSALISDVLIFFPSAILFALHSNRGLPFDQQVEVLAYLLFNPLMILVDHGHFQFNSVMLGFSLLAFVSLFSGHDLLASFCFVCALNFKQMSLYYAPAVFVYLLRRCYGKHTLLEKFIHICKLGLVVLLSFALLWSPWLGSGVRFSSVVHRLFPVARGLFEDKVANLWVALHPVLKVKFLPLSAIIRFSTVLTVLGFSPFLILLWLCPTRMSLTYSLFGSSLSFFLFSFQVHEKTILVPLLPALLLVREVPSLIAEFSMISTYSLWPLFKKDGLMVPYGVFMCITVWTTISNGALSHKGKKSSVLWGLFVGSSATSFILLHLAEILFVPPPRYPDLFPYLNAVVVFGHLVLAWITAIVLQWQVVGDNRKQNQKKVKNL